MSILSTTSRNLYRRSQGHGPGDTTLPTPEEVTAYTQSRNGQINTIFTSFDYQAASMALVAVWTLIGATAGWAAVSIATQGFGDTLGTFVLANPFFWMGLFLVHAVLFHFVKKSHARLGEYLGTTPQNATNELHAVQNISDNLFHSIKDDLTRAGYQVTDENRDNFTYTTPQGVISMGYNKKDELFLLNNGKVIQQTYSSKVLYPEAKKRTTVTGTNTTSDIPATFRGA